VDSNFNIPPSYAEAICDGIMSFVDEPDLDLVSISVGIRIYPNTFLADQAVKEGRISSRDNLIFPTFYVVNNIKEWIYETVESWAKDRPNWTL
jgi:hypothetical protein